MPHILITNDDGITPRACARWSRRVRDLGTVSVVAPSQERSAASQSLTLRQPIFCEQVAEREWSVEGTPADAMIVALHQLFSAAAARPGDLRHQSRRQSWAKTFFIPARWARPWRRPSTMCRRLPFPWPIAGRALSMSRRRSSRGGWPSSVLTEGLPAGVLLNVNVPLEWKGGVRFTRQSKKVTRNVLQEGTDPRGRTYYWLSEQQVIEERGPGERLRGRFDGRDLHHADRTGPHARGVPQSPIALGQVARALARALADFSHGSGKSGLSLQQSDRSSCTGRNLFGGFPEPLNRLLA